MAAAYLFFFFFFLPFLIHLANADARINILQKTCNATHVQNQWDYMTSYTQIINRIEDQIDRNKFGFANEGRPPEQLFIMAQCQEDLSPKDCSICFYQSYNTLSGCYPSTGGRVYLDGCFIRGENYSFYHETFTTEDSKRCSNNRRESQAFKNMTRRLISKLVKEAPKNNGYAAGYEISENLTIYAMATCWKTLDKNECAGCLDNASLSAFSCLPSTEGHALNAGCFLRYSDSEFVNINNTSPSDFAIFTFITYIIGFITICGLAIAVGVSVGKFAYKKIHRPKNRIINEIDKDLSLYKRSLQFKYSTLEKATQHFNIANKLGQGGCGEVFKGNLADGREIAIKRLFISGKNRIQDVYNEMDIISRAQHKNLVRFLGCSLTNHDSLLVYEFLANKSLDCILFDPEKKKELNWKLRLGIIIGTAEGLEYLHKNCQVRIIHRDIKASNVLLDLRHRPKIADFGLARFYKSERKFVTTGIAGTIGYMAPEYLARGRLTEKVDVYSFGVLTLEIISGIQNNKFKPDDSLDTIITTAWKHFQSDTVKEIIDESMEIADDVEEIKRVVQVGLLCTQELPSFRPTMTKIIQMLTQKDIDLPIPSKPPFIEESMEISRSCGSSPLRQPSPPSFISCKSSNSDD